jgi:DNA topoisomerase I
VVAAVKQVATTLQNRPATCRKYYIHPAVLDAYADGTLFEAMESAKPQEVPYGLSREEMALLRIVIADIPGHKAPVKTI